MATSPPSPSREPSDHVRRLLRDDEQCLWSSKPKTSAFFITSFVGNIVLLGFFMIWAGLFVIPFGYKFLESSAPATLRTIQDTVTSLGVGGILLAVPSVIVLGALLVTMTVSYLRYSHRELALTDDRAIKTSGLVGRDSSTVALKDIRDINVDVGLVDKIFGTGSIKVQVAGGESAGWSFRELDDPYAVLNEIEDARKGAETAGKD
jgi:uncharacterized membrane protein YdbT with pleckstrin-like domain